MALATPGRPAGTAVGPDDATRALEHPRRRAPEHEDRDRRARCLPAPPELQRDRRGAGLSILGFWAATISAVSDGRECRSPLPEDQGGRRGIEDVARL